MNDTHDNGLNPKGASMRKELNMDLKAPGIITFLISIILTVIVLISKFFGAEIPFLQYNEFWALLFAQILLILACLSRAL